MNKQHWAFFVVVVALSALVVWELNKPNTTDVATVDTPAPLDAGDSIILTPDNASGPAYLTYNTPWAFSPPVQNFLPKTTAGQIGEVAGQGPDPFSGGCGCMG